MIMRDNKIFAITMGDASGVGPEIILHSYQKGELKHRNVVFGDLTALDYYNSQLGYDVPLRPVHSVRDWNEGALNVLDFGLLRPEDLTPGMINRNSGAAAREYIIAASKAALNREVAAMVTLPVNKEATQLSDPAFVGHTELIGAVCGVSDVTIMLVSDQLIVTHVTTHVSLATAIALAKQERIRKIILMTVEAVRKLRDNPRIAVAGLNPHAGENGLFGREDIEEIRPSVKWAQAQGMPVEGPVPPDTAFYLAVRKRRYDATRHAVSCNYREQCASCL